MLTAYSTQPIDQHRRLAYWTEAICETFLKVDCRKEGDAPFHGEMRGCQLSNLDLIDVVSPAMEYRRGAIQIQGRSEEHFQLVLQISGVGHLWQCEREAVLLPGDVALYTSTAPSSIAYPKGSRTIAMKLPRQCVLDRIKCCERALALSLKGDSAMGGLVGSMMRESFALGFEQGVVDDGRLSSGLLDIIAYAFDHQPEPSRTCSRDTPLAQIKKFMQANLADSEMQLVDVAQKHNVSMRTLNRLFAAEGSSASRWLWLQRLEASYRSLRNGDVRQVSEAALGCGFNDLSHFSKSFKKAYGIAPNELLRKSER